MKEKFKTKGTNSNSKAKGEDSKVTPSNHEDFKLGQGYGSGETESEFQTHRSKKQYGDNPVPKSGGGYGRAGEAQPHEEQDSL